MEITPEQIFEALKNCYDPEIPVNVVDLGLVYDVKVNEDSTVDVKMTLTAQGCGMGPMIADDAVNKIMEEIPDVKEARVDLVWDPPWSPDMMSEDAKMKLGWA